MIFQGVNSQSIDYFIHFSVYGVFRELEISVIIHANYQGFVCRDTISGPKLLVPVLRQSFGQKTF